MTTLAPAVLDTDPRNNRFNADYRIGLLQAAAPFPADTRWQGGITYRPINSNVPSAANSTFYPCNAAFNVETETQTTVSWDPWGIALGDECLSGSTDEDEENARAERRLQLETEYLLSRTFWTGDVGSGTFASVGAPNRPLADTASDELTTTGPVGIVTGFSRLIQYLADTIGSQRGMIHVAPAVLPFLAFYGVAVRDGFQVLTTIADHVVVPGTGYDGSAPDGSAAGAGTTWIYATSMVRAAAAPIQVHSYLNRSGETNVNMWETRASRIVIAEWDLQAHGAVQVCLPDPGPSCTEIPS